MSKLLRNLIKTANRYYFGQVEPGSSQSRIDKFADYLDTGKQTNSTTGKKDKTVDRLNDLKSEFKINDKLDNEESNEESKKRQQNKW